ncbi:helix-turn-helix domain-containing protein [Deinococcus aetherius]|nr:helix-turn-helix transcriptional regulator [Deinococcus aetherius]
MVKRIEVKEGEFVMRFDPEQFPALAKEAKRQPDETFDIPALTSEQSSLGDDIERALIVATIGEALKTVRQQAGVSGAAAGEAIGINRQRVSQLERLSTANVELATLVKYLHGLGYDLSLTLKPRGGGREIVTTI